MTTLQHPILEDTELEPARSPRREAAARPESRSRASYPQTRWDLSDLLPASDEAFIRQRLDALEQETRAFEARRSQLRPDMEPAHFVDVLRQYEALVSSLHVVDAYAHLWFASDTQSDEALSFRNRCEQLLTQLSNRTLFFSLWWKELSDEEAERLLPTERELADFRHYLLDRRRWKPFTLDEAAEKIINLKSADGIGGLTTLYSILTNRLEFRLEVDGQEQLYTRDRLMSFAYAADPDLRTAAYKELYRVYGAEATVLGQIYTYRVRDWHNENVDLRGFSSPIAVRNTSNDVPDEAVDILLDVARENRGLFQRYFQLKAGWLGMERLRRYDIYAPLAESSREVSWQEAVNIVLDTFYEFEPRVGELAERVFSQGHIDSEVRKGKRGGAFCSTVLPEYTPWVLVNFTGRMRNVAELAHELGHAVHSMLADHHSVLTQHPSLPLAETASVFSEMLVTDRLLAWVTEPLARRELLSELVSDVYATVLRQAYFVRFELAAHQAVMEGKSLAELNALYMDNLEDQFGDSVEVSEEFQYEWLSIPHIYSTPFYCYSYSFGQLLVLALYRRFRQEGESFKPGYLKLLAYGGAARPQEILEEAGIDITDRSFWQGGFDVVRDLVEELEEAAP